MPPRRCGQVPWLLKGENRMVCKTEMEVTIHATFSRFSKCLNGVFDCSRVKCPLCQG